jgi:hypothetical protein
MKGSFYFHVKSKKVLFEFSIRRNITVIKGDSATGKTTLLHMLYEYLRVGRESGYSVSTNANYFVYMRQEVGRGWQDALLSLKDTIIFIEENNDFVFGEEFAEFVKKSGNYFVLVTRAPLKMLPYSIHEIYEIVTHGKHADVKELYHELRELYSNYPIANNNQISAIVTEDSNSGYQFFADICKERIVVGANGNSNVLNTVKSLQAGDILVVVDGAAYGAMIEENLEYFETAERRRITAWMPESFEYLILKSEIVKVKKLSEILGHTSDYVECSEYESWEQFFTKLLMSVTKDTEYAYSKQSLSAFYLQEKNVKRLLEQFPKEIKTKI